MQDSTNKNDLLPFFLKGTVIKGFGRGSKELGFPTANFSEDLVDTLSPLLKNGVYYGVTSIDNANTIYKMAANIGFCPYYKNSQRSFETHIIHKFDHDFYGSILKVILIGYIREELNFTSKEELIAKINNDINFAQHTLKDCIITEDMVKFLKS